MEATETRQATPARMPAHRPRHVWRPPAVRHAPLRTAAPAEASTGNARRRRLTRNGWAG
jgi:hypothetical protein